MDAFDKKISLMMAKAEAVTKNKNNDKNKDGRGLDDNLVAKSNALSRAYYKFTLTEKRVMESFISQLDSRRSDNSGFEDKDALVLRATDYAKLFSSDSSNAYRDMKGAVQSLLKKTVIVQRNETTQDEFSIMLKATYVENEGRVLVHFNPLLVPHLQQLRKNYGAYPIKNAANYVSIFTWRLYEILVSWSQDKTKTDGKFLGWMTVDIADFRRQLGVPDSYNYNRFATVVMATAQKELLEKSNIIVRYARVKTGRKITHFKITFMEDEQMSLL